MLVMLKGLFARIALLNLNTIVLFVMIAAEVPDVLRTSKNPWFILNATIVKSSTKTFLGPAHDYELTWSAAFVDGPAIVEKYKFAPPLDVRRTSNCSFRLYTKMYSISCNPLFLYLIPKIRYRRYQIYGILKINKQFHLWTMIYEQFKDGILWQKSLKA